MAWVAFVDLDWLGVDKVGCTLGWAKLSWIGLVCIGVARVVTNEIDLGWCGFS